MSKEDKKSAVEGIKESSDALRGEIGAELKNDADHFSGDSVQLLKHHGTYQQDNRDERAAARAAGDRSKHYSFMVRTRVPGGRLTSEQLLAELALGDELGCGNLRVTSRQALQLHGVLKTNLKQVMRRIHQVDLTTLGACGDVNRNTMCCPVPYADHVHEQLQETALQISREFAPRTKAYRDIWLIDDQTGERQRVDGGEDVEPLYGKTYLPRKFKIGVALPHDNCIDVYANDIGLLAVVEQGRVAGFNVLAGGGMGVTPSNKKTYPALAKKLGFVNSDQAVDVCRAIIKVQRDHGNRSDRKIARMKYLVDRLGIDEFRRLVEAHFGAPLQPLHPVDVHEAADHLGWEEQGDGRWYYGLNVENGRLADTEQMQLKSAIREVCEQLSPGIRLTAHQSVLFTDIQAQDRPALEQILTRHRVTLSEQGSNARRWSMACVALPTCGLAITESERALPGIMDELEKVLEQLDLEKELFSVHMTGCPNGCARPYNSDVGIVGKARGRYTLLLGGNRLGTRLNFIYKDLVPGEEIVSTLAPILGYFKQGRQADETFGDFCHRVGKDELLAHCEANV